MDTIRIKVNGQDVDARPGSTILETVRELGLDRIPTLCHAPELKPYGSCFVCVVEVKGRPNLVPSCATRVAPGMEVETRNPRVVASRKTALELLLSNHYADCVSPCRLGCPAGVDAQGYIALAAMGLEKEAVDLIREANPLPAVCGRVCVRKCEVVCRRVDVDAPVGINAIKRYVTDAPGVYDETPAREPSRGKSVGIVGAGPAGLTAAWFLARKGYEPVLYEAQPRGGGMLRYGIPNYRLPDDVMDREIAHVVKAGARIHYGVRVGRDVTLDQLQARHDALFLGTGAWVAKDMRIPDEHAVEGVLSGIDFLKEKADDPTPIPGTVAVVGGGNTAMDVARTSWRCGADKVIVVYRRTRAEMPADPLEIEDCLHEGIEIMELVAPVGLVSEGGRLKALRCIRMVLGEPDASGRRRPVPLEGSEFDLPCHWVISAIGQDPVLDGLTRLGDADVALTRWKTFKVDTATMKTNIPGVFAGGDAADDGPTVVIDAIRDGQRAARTIHAHLSGEALPQAPFGVTKAFWAKPGKAELGEVQESPRHEVQMLDVEDRRGSFREVATGFDPEDAAHEADRCLSCGCVRELDCELRLQAEEYGVGMERFAGYVRKHKVDDRHPWIVYDPNKCVLCARCIRTCARVLPISALGLVGRGFRTEMRPAMNDPLVETSCVSCGNCVDACPTGALTVKTAFPGRAALVTDDVATHCGFCALGCEITVKRFGRDRYYVGPSGTPGAYLCRYGRFGYELFVRQKRLVKPTIRDGGLTREAEFGEAWAAAAAGLKAVAERHGSEALAVFVSPELSNEEMILAGRIAREALGTPWVGSLALVASGRRSGALDPILGITASTADRSVLRDADLVICNNTSMESDHLVLAVEIAEAVREHGARLVVVNSTLDSADRKLATLALDPMRGRAAIFWSAVIRAMVQDGFPARETIEELPGGHEFLAMLDALPVNVSMLTGVDGAAIEKAAYLVRAARRVVVVHSPDRPQDASPGDLEVLGQLVVLLRAMGIQADILLPGMCANEAGTEVTGADPGFLLGRCAVDGEPDAAMLADLLADGVIRGVLVLGEDPLRADRTAAWFRNVEFLVAMDWTPTETTQAADVVLPGSTCLEAEGTRCSFEGRVLRFAQAVAPPSGRAGWEVLAGLAEALGLRTAGLTAQDLAREAEEAVREAQGTLAPFYWNTGQDRPELTDLRLTAAGTGARPGPIPPPLTHVERYKRDIREVGTERFRVRSR